MNFADLNTPPFPEEDAQMIQSTRIRIGRNLADFPLGPGVSKQQRVEIEANVVAACSKFTGDLKGTYYSLGTMTEAERN